MPFTRTYNWGESLRLEAAMADGGLKAATDRIASTMGRAYGSRNTFAALFDLVEPPTSPIQRERAYLLLIALDLDPDEWGMGDFEQPVGWPKTAADLLRRQSRCTARSLAAA